MGIADPTSMLEFVKASGQADAPGEFLDRPFDSKPQYQQPQSRFSDGTFPVFYSAIEFETAKAEMRHHVPMRLLIIADTGSRTAFFQEVQCDFSGPARNLRPQAGTLTCLTAEPEDGGYDECNEIAREARALGLSGLITPSARRVEGSCLPVFERRSLGNPSLGRWIAFSLDVDSGEIRYTEVA